MLFISLNMMNFIIIRIDMLSLKLFSRLGQCVIEKENNFKQPGERYRSWSPDRYFVDIFLGDGFVCLMVAITCISSSSRFSPALDQARTVY